MIRDKQVVAAPWNLTGIGDKRKHKTSDVGYCSGDLRQESTTVLNNLMTAIDFNINGSN